MLDFFSRMMNMADQAGSATVASDAEAGIGPAMGKRKLTLRFASDEQRRAAAARIMETGLLRVRVNAEDLEDDE